MPANLSRLGGWWRLWAVLSAILGASVFALTFEPNPQRLEWSEIVPTSAKIDYDQWGGDRLAGRACKEDFVFPLRYKRSASTDWLQMWCSPRPNYIKPIGLALIPAIAMLLLGLTFSWVRAGFKAGRE